MNLCHLEHTDLATYLQTYNRGRVVPRGDNIKDDFGCKTVFTEGALASQVPAAKSSTTFLATPERLAKQTVHCRLTHKVYMRDAPETAVASSDGMHHTLDKAPRNRCRANWDKINDRVVPLDRHLYGSTEQVYCGNKHWKTYDTKNVWKQ